MVSLPEAAVAHPQPSFATAAPAKATASIRHPSPPHTNARKLSPLRAQLGLMSTWPTGGLKCQRKGDRSNFQILLAPISTLRAKGPTSKTSSRPECWSINEIFQKKSAPLPVLKVISLLQKELRWNQWRALSIKSLRMKRDIMINLNGAKKNIQGLRDPDNRNLISLGNGLSAQMYQEGDLQNNGNLFRTPRFPAQNPGGRQGRFLRGRHARKEYVSPFSW